jgi:hypothetical protein
MKKLIYSLGISSFMALAITSCKQGNAEEMMKNDMEKVNANVQSKIDELNMTLSDECNTKVMEAAQTAFAAMPKTTVKTTVKKPATKPTTTTTTTKTTGGLGDGKKGTTTTTDVKIGEGKKGTTTTTTEVKLGAGKKGLQNK